MTTKKGLLDPLFRYTPSHATDIRKTWDRIRKERKKQAAQVVQPIRKKDA